MTSAYARPCEDCCNTWMDPKGYVDCGSDIEINWNDEDLQEKLNYGVCENCKGLMCGDCSSGYLCYHCHRSEELKIIKKNLDIIYRMKINKSNSSKAKKQIKELIDSTDTIVEDDVTNQVHKRYNVCEQCGSNCQKSRTECYKCKRKRLRREKAEEKLSLLK